MRKHLLLAIALLCAVVQGAWAQTEVSSEGALTTALSGTSPINIKLTADIALSNYLGIGDGENSKPTVTIDLNGHTLSRSLDAADGNGHVIWVRTGSTLTVIDSSDNPVTPEYDGNGKLTGGYATNGGGICNYGTLYFQSGTITSCQTDYTGGAIRNNGTATISGGVITNCSAPYGGALYNTGTLTISGGTISNSSSTTGGGGGLVNIGTVEISGGTFSENTAKTDGGAIWNGNSGSAHGTLTITGGSITSNTATNYGGGIWNENEVTITNCEISSNKGDDGGGFYNKADGNVTINSGTTFSGNTSENHSGGAINNHGKLTVNGGSFTSNTAKNNGGAIGNFDSGVLTINGGSFTDNSASTYYGGGVYIGSGTFNLSGSVTITSNTANSKTDNLYLYSDNIINVTGALTSSSNKIGVTLEGYDRDFTSGFKANNSSAQPSDFFSSDVDYATLSFNDNETEAKLTITSVVTYVERAWEGGNTDGKVVSKTKRLESYSTYNGEGEISGNGWYILNGTGCSNRVTVRGDVKFILQDGTTTEFSKGIYIEKDSKLTIYPQPSGTGTLNCPGAGSDHAAIGGQNNKVGGHLVIHGGTIEASASENNAAAIGGGDGEDTGMQSVTIYGGTVKATGKSSGAGIGGGQENNTVPSVTIYGGEVTATGGNYAAGIGGSEESTAGTVKIYGGKVTATGGKDGAGIGGGENGDCGKVYIYGGEVTASSNDYGAGIGGGENGDNGTVYIYKGKVTATGGTNGAGIGGGKNGGGGTVYIYGGDVTAKGGDYGAGIGGDDLTIKIYGGKIHATGIVNDDNNGGPGIGVMNGDGKLYFTMDDGELTADVSTEYSNKSPAGGAGIGGCNGENVELHVTINGGTVNATGGPKGAGIGGAGGDSGADSSGANINSGSEITINGGIVNATGKDGGAGIGAGYSGNQKGTITINGGTVTAKGGDNRTGTYPVSGGAGIGGGGEQHGGQTGGNGGTIIINGGTVKATPGNSGNDPAEAIGHGEDDGGSGTLTLGDNLCVTNDNGSTTYGKDERVSKCRDYATRVVKVCEHSEKICTSNGDSGHTISCSYCSKTGSESHNFDTDGHTCKSCSYVMTDLKTITIYEANSAGTGYNSTPTTYSVQYNTTFTLPECSSVPNNMWFAGWKKTTTEPASIQAESSEFSSLKAAGTEITVTDDVTYYARYHTSVWPGGGNGTAGDPYLISTEEDWNEFVNAVSYKNFDFGGRYIKLTKNISVTEMVGTISTRFRGTFDGNGYTLTVNYDTSEEYTAPFRFVGSATIKNLNVGGKISTSVKFASGLIGGSNGTNANVTNCRVSVTINSTVNGDGTHGGFVANITSGTVNINGCIFDGSMTGNSTTNCGGFVGWISGTAANLTDCLFMPTSLGLSSGCYTFVRRADRSSISNCFYTSALGTAQGTQAYTVKSDTEGLTLDYGSGNNYGSITAYTFDQGDETTLGGLLYDDVLYTGGTTKVTFTPEAKYSFTAVKANGTELTANSDGTYSVTLSNADVTITADKGTNNLELNDAQANTTTIEANNGRYADVTISARTLYKDGSWNTFCVPFDITAEQIANNTNFSGATIMELDTETEYSGHKTGFDGETLYLYFKEATKIKAGRPYIVKWGGNSSFTSPTFTSSEIEGGSPRTVTSDDGYVSFVGNYDPVNIGASGDNTKLYLGSGNKLYWPSGSRSINAFRAYFQLNDIEAGEPNSTDPNTPLVRAFVLNFGDDDETTGIVGVEHGILNIEHSAATGWYDLSGRKLSGKPTKKGIYIYNGKKRVIK